MAVAVTSESVVSRLERHTEREPDEGVFQFQVKRGNLSFCRGAWPVSAITEVDAAVDSLVRLALQRDGG
jgi:hypothetical protein